MALWLEVSLALMGFLLTLAAAFAGIGYFLQGKDSKKLNANTILEQDVNALTKRVGDQETKITDLTSKIEKLRSENKELTEELRKTMDILKGRDPDTLAFLKSVNDYITRTTEIFDTLKKFLDKQSL